ncbi:MAG: MTH895/ArsE family thioredoxin-like protein [Minisyncoccales bacterium]
MNKISIEWKHFDKEGKTCERCSGTGSNLLKVISKMQKELGVEISFKETKLPEGMMSESNEILIDGVLLENFIPNIKTGENKCPSCSELIDQPDSCNCRTLNQGEKIFEEIPIELIEQAILSIINTSSSLYSQIEKIEVFGSGCDSCKKLLDLTKKAVAEMGLDIEVEYIDDIKKAIELGVMSFPVLAINGKPIIIGMIPSVEEIKKTITDYKEGATKTKENSSGCSCGGNC